MSVSRSALLLVLRRDLAAIEAQRDRLAAVAAALRLVVAWYDTQLNEEEKPAICDAAAESVPASQPDSAALAAARRAIRSTPIHAGQ